MQPRTIQSSASQNLEGKNSTPSKAAPRALPEERASTVGRARGYSVGAVQGKAVTSTLNAPTNVLAALMGKGPLNSMTLVIATNKMWGKAADETSIIPIKLNLHVYVRERGKSSIKGGRSSPEKGTGDQVQELEPPRPCRRESLLG